MKHAGIIVLGVLLLPLLWLPLAWITPIGESAEDAWAHVATTLLHTYALGTLILALVVACASSVLGITAAWAVTFLRFPLRHVCRVLLVMPLALPAYAIAYPYTQLASLGQLSGTAIVLTLATYPYVYLAACVAFATQPREWREASETLGIREFAFFWRVTLPAARPFWAMGAILAMMEAVADIGVASMMGLPTLATGVLRSWFYLGEPWVAARLAMLLLVTVVAVLALERMERTQRAFGKAGAVEKTLHTLPLFAGLSVLACVVMLLTASVFMPIGYWMWLEAHSAATLNLRAIFDYAGDSITIASLAGVVAVVISTLLHSLERSGGRMQRTAHLLAYAGYAVPGVAVAVSMLLFSGKWHELTGTALFTGTLYGVVVACVIRFLATSMGQVHSGFERIPPELDMAARSLGTHGVGLFWRVHVPLLWRSLVVALLVVMVDTLKELPATLILRPFDMKPLAIVAYEFASDDRAVEAAPFILCLIAVCSICILALFKLQRLAMKTPWRA